MSDIKESFLPLYGELFFPTDIPEGKSNAKINESFQANTSNEAYEIYRWGFISKDFNSRFNILKTDMGNEIRGISGNLLSEEDRILRNYIKKMDDSRAASFKHRNLDKYMAEVYQIYNDYKNDYNILEKVARHRRNTQSN